MIVAGVTPPAVISGGCPNFGRVTCPNFGRMLGHSISILLNTCAHFIPTMQDEAAQPARKSSSLGFAAKYAAQLMDDILTPIPIKLNPIST
jgi:hypothetical protein